MRSIAAAIIASLLAGPVLANGGQSQNHTNEQQKPAIIPATPLVGVTQNKAKSNDTAAANPNTPARTYQALVMEYRKAQQAFSKRLRNATREDRTTLSTEWKSKHEEYVAKFMDLAEQNPKDPAAVDALAWVVMNGSYAFQQSPRARALALLLRDHVTSDRLAQVCQSLSHEIRTKGAEPFLRGVMDKNPSARLRALACLALAQELAQKSELAADLKDENKAKQLERSLGKDLVSELKGLKSAKLAAESEHLFQTFAERYLGQWPADQFSTLVQRLSRGGSKGSALVLRRIMDDAVLNVSPETRGKACMAVAGMLKGRADALPDNQLNKADALIKQSEALCERVIAKYADISSFRGTLGDQAKKLLYELRFLSRGKTVPEVEGEDLDGKSFKLSDYRGKVVLLDFWGNW